MRHLQHDGPAGGALVPRSGEHRLVVVGDERIDRRRGWLNGIDDQNIGRRRVCGFADIVDGVNRDAIRGPSGISSEVASFQRPARVAGRVADSFPAYTSVPLTVTCSTMAFLSSQSPVSTGVLELEQKPLTPWSRRKGMALDFKGPDVDGAAGNPAGEPGRRGLVGGQSRRPGYYFRY